MSRREDLEQFVELAGTDQAQLREAGDGWPGTVDIRIHGDIVHCAVHVGPIGASHRGRDAVERRFQNPGKKPLQQPEGALPLLIGIWNEGASPVLVGMEVSPHRLTAETRQSYFIPLSLLQQAEVTGWADHASGSGERIVAFRPELLSIYVEALSRGVVASGAAIAAIASAAGVVEPQDLETPAERARRVASVLIRDAAFSDLVLGAYGHLCAICDLNFGLVEGAHIYPARAPGSPDEVWNGLALCSNHHAAFDRHRIYVAPLPPYSITLHPELLTNQSLNSTCASFVAGTRPALRLPTARDQWPRPEMLQRRYDYSGDAYDWARP